MHDSEALEVEITGDVVERQELLNRTLIVTLEGASVGGEWTFVGGLSWVLGQAGRATEGDITLTNAGGDELFASLTGGDVREADAADDADHRLALEYEIDGGSGQYADARGAIRADGSLQGEGFRARLSVTLGNA